MRAERESERPFAESWERRHSSKLEEPIPGGSNVLSVRRASCTVDNGSRASKAISDAEEVRNPRLSKLPTRYRIASNTGGSPSASASSRIKRSCREVSVTNQSQNSFPLS